MNNKQNTNRRSDADILTEIREWAEEMPYYLSNREGYPKGYRDGVIRARKIVMSIITGIPIED